MSARSRWRHWLRKIPRKPKSRTVWRSGRVILKGAEMTQLRRDVFERAEGRCEVATHWGRCNTYAAWDGWQHGELSHRIDKAHGGSDSIENCLWSCAPCHRRRHPGPQFAFQRRSAAGVDAAAHRFASGA